MVPGQPPQTPSRSRSTAKPPPFTPRKRKDSTDSLHPETPSSVDDSPLVQLAPGCSLLIRGLADKRSTDPVAALEKWLDAARAKDPSLAEISVVTKMFKPYDVSWSSSCYLHLDEAYSPTASQGPEAEPRTDLLDKWRDSLLLVAPSLEIVYSPNKTDVDKRLWLRLPDLKGRSKEECANKILPSITDELEARGIPVLSRFPSNGGPILVLAKPSDVDRFSRAGHIVFKEPIGRQAVTKVKQLEIRNAYEVGIVGFPDYMEGLEKQVVDWIKQQLPSKVADHGRDLGDDTILAISMVDWESTRQLLQLGEAFLKKFSIYDNTMTPPTLLFQINEAGLFRKRTVRTMVGDGVEAMQKLTSEVEKIKRDMITRDEFDGHKREYAMDRKLLQAQLEVMTQGTKALVTRVSELADRQTRGEQATLCNSQAVAHSNRLHHVKNAITNMRMTFYMESDPARKEELSKFIKELEEEEKSLPKMIQSSSSEVTTLLSGPAGLSLPPAPNQEPASCQPQASSSDQQPPDDSVIPPGLSLVPRRRSSAGMGSRSGKEKRQRLGNNGTQRPGEGQMQIDREDDDDIRPL